MSRFDGNDKRTTKILNYDVSDDLNRENLREHLKICYSAEMCLESSYILNATQSPHDLVVELSKYIDTDSDSDGIVINEVEGKGWDAYPERLKRKIAAYCGMAPFTSRTKGMIE